MRLVFFALLSSLAMNAPAGLAMNAPAGLAMNAPAGLAMNAPAGLAMSAPGGMAKPATGVTKTGSSAPGASAQFSVSEQTQVPGATLRPGAYKIQVLDHLSDRMIVEIDGVSGATHTTFIGVPSATLPKAGSAGVIRYGAGADGKNALRGFQFANGMQVEFVYPKTDAVALAKANGEKVPAIDPESEGRVAASDLSQKDMQMVTLWMLSTTNVSGGDPAVKAERFKQVAAVRPRPVLAALPHTGSLLPALWAAGMLSLLGAAVLRFRRVKDATAA